MRVLPIVLLAGAAALLPVSASASDATTTRIETRSFYGATVTIEGGGVRVFRPLPPHSKVIINPGGRTPVNLGFEENRWVSHNTNTNYNYNYERPVGADGGQIGGFIGDGHKRHRPHHRSHRGRNFR